MNPFSALVIKDFRTYWFGSLFAMFGHRLIIVAISLLIYRLTGSALSLGIVAAATAIPIMFFNFLGGVISDKYNVRRILTILSLSISITLLILSYLDYSERVEPFHIYICSILLGILLGIDFPARNSYFPKIIPEKYLRSGVSLNGATMAGSSVVVPTIGGFLISYYGSFIGIFLSASSLINLGTSIFLICFGIIFFLYEDRKIKSLFNLLLGFGIIHLIFLSIYIINGSLNEYLMAMFQIPISYGTTDFSLTSSLTVFLSSFVNYSLPIYILILVSISLFIHMNLKMIKKGTFKFDNSELIFLIIFGLLFFNLAGKGYYHHLIFLLYFLSLSFIFFQNKIIKKGVVLLLFLITGFTISQFVDSSLNNIRNFSNLNEQYPMKMISNEIILSNFEYDEIFSTNYILILYYLDKPNMSYVVHPALYDYEEITSVLLENNKIEDNETSYQIDNMPKIFEGYSQQIVNDSNYFKLEVPDIDNSLLNYWGKDNNVVIFVKK